MKQSLETLTSFTIQTTDGLKGHIKDFLFDEKQWIIRYLEADFGTFFQSRKVLIPRVFLKNPQWQEKHFPVDLATSEIDKCPHLEEHLPVSRKYEQALYRHYNLPVYWSGSYFGPVGKLKPPEPGKPPEKTFDEDEPDTILRSFNEINGYTVHALDGRLGHIDDMIIDDAGWQVVYAVIDTSNWLPWSKKVLIAVEWILKISYFDGEVMINLPTETINNAPEYHPTLPLDDNYEKTLYDFFTGSLIK